MFFTLLLFSFDFMSSFRLTTSGQRDEELGLGGGGGLLGGLGGGVEGVGGGAHRAEEGEDEFERRSMITSPCLILDEGVGYAGGPGDEARPVLDDVLVDSLSHY